MLRNFLLLLILLTLLGTGHNVGRIYKLLSQQPPVICQCQS